MQRCVVILSLLLIAYVVAVSAGPADYAFEAVRTPGFILLVPSGELIPDLGPTIETLYAQVSDLWQPELGLCVDQDDTDRSARPYEADTSSDLARLGLPGPPPEPLSGTCAHSVSIVALYRSVNDLDWDYRLFDLAGIVHSGRTFTADQWQYSEGFSRVLARYTGDGPLPLTDLFAAITGYPDGDWRSEFAHEATHLLQEFHFLTESETPLPLRLFLEGMARVTEWRLGFLDAVNVTHLQVAAYWVQRGGDPADPPDFILYALGTALVESICRVAGEVAFWGLSSPQALGFDPVDLYDRGLTDSERSDDEAGFEQRTGMTWQRYLDAPFEERFAAMIGLGWSEFLDRWLADLVAAGVSSEARAVYEWRRRNVTLRVALLEPLLLPAQVDELVDLSNRVFGGVGSVTDVDRAEQLLDVDGAGLPVDVVDEVVWRIPTLEKHARLVGGAAAVQAVYALSIRRAHIGDDPSDYLAAYADIVNRLLVWPDPADSASGP